MKQLFTAGILATLFACGSHQQPDTKNAPTALASADSGSQKPPAIADTTQVANEVVLPGANNEGLYQLAGKKVFSTLNHKLRTALPESLQEFFSDSSNLDLLTYSKGNLFLNDKEDYALVVYNNQQAKVMILVYDALNNKLSALYDDIKVENELKSLNCNSETGDLIRDIEDKIIEQRDDLLKEPAKYLESPAIKIADLSTDKDIMIKDGCLSKHTTKADYKNALCIASSSIYNNWVCVRYNKAKNHFVVFFSQVFAD